MEIKNGDMPAMPIELNGFGLYEPSAFLGLTKREQFAMAALQGLLSGGYCINEPHYRLNDVPSEAVALADALLAELERIKS